ncbi:hypothetical protein PIROE2DRAFT_1151 [Piromyces sp. E2]|nr:hypothetical protein PIROE2DRAFT_1151 [Piromyces sp. E2]|eukprot:OUM70624.1 hypothetical protein PIROE2DRAFT_1151 [Piromyces sp. E2]
MSNSNANKQSNNVMNENDIRDDYDSYMNSSSGMDALTQFPSLADENILNNDLKNRPRNDSVNTVKSDTDTYGRVRANSNRGEKSRNKREGDFSRPRSKSRDNSISSYSNHNYDMQHIRSNSGTDELNRASDSSSRTRRNNSESDTVYRRKMEGIDNKIGRNNSNKSEIIQKMGFDGSDTRVRRINSNHSNHSISESKTENSINDGKTKRNDMVMDIGIPHDVKHKKSKSSGGGGGDDRNASSKMQRSKSNSNMRKKSSPIRPSQGFNHFRGEANSTDSYSKYSQDSRKNSNTDRIQYTKRKDAQLYDISTSTANDNETSSTYVTPLNYQPELSLNALPMDSPKSFISISESTSTKKNDISFPFPPSSTTILNPSNLFNTIDNSHIRSSSYSSGDKIQENSSSSSENLSNKIRANSLKSQISENNMNKPIGYPKSILNSSAAANLDNTNTSKGIEPQSVNDEINGDTEYKGNYNDQLNNSNNTPILSNEIMKLKSKHRNTIIIPSDYIIDNKSSSLIGGKDKKMGSEPILYNNMKGELCDVDIQKIKSNPSGLSKKGSVDSLNKSMVNKIIINNGVLEDGSGTGKIFHPVRSHSLHANKMFNGLTLTDVPDENGIFHKLVTKKSSSSLNELTRSNNQNFSNFSTLSKIPEKINSPVHNEKINRSNTINTIGIKKNNLNPERTNTINSKMYLKSNSNNSDNNKKIYEQLYKRNNTLTADIEEAKKIMNSEFEINDKDMFTIIDDSDIELTENPLLSSNPIFVMCPNLIDAISTSIPIDAYDFSDDEDEPPTPLCLETDEDFDPTEGLHTEPRGYVVSNLYETEKNYLSDLYTLNNFFKEKLKNIISPVALNSIFEGVDDLLELHKRFYKSLHKVVCNWNKNSLVGKVFIEYRHEWQIYQNFIDNYARSLEAIRREEDTNPQFRQFMKDCLTSTETNRKSLKEYLMFPVQRTTRYSLIIKDLIKFIDQSHPDYEDLNLALKEMTLLATKVNEVKRREEETTSMFTAFEQTENCPPTIITHKRRLIHQIDVLDVLSKSRRQMHIFLFSDLFMLTKTTRNANNTTTNIISHPLVRALRSHSKQMYRYIRCIDYRDISIEEDEQYRKYSTFFSLF